ncbi:muscle-specific protein 20 isoform X2 [Periplaneta americana]|uniref:muscle-specific protein 20 isoform X2 n=1 Tax=Periplaneta americana TaxID=6978 RepID=UPI0037E6FA0E
MSLERQVRAKLAGKRDAQQEKEAQEWMEAVLGEKFPPGEAYEDVLRDGQVLCKLMNKICPGSIPKINTSGGQFKMMENINVFQQALKNYGVADVDVFQTVDLWEKKDIAQVTTTLFALGRTILWRHLFPHMDETTSADRIQNWLEEDKRKYESHKERIRKDKRRQEKM